MSSEELHTRLSQRPFVPFRVVVTEGATYDVRHPELVMLGKRSAVIGLAKKPEQTFYDGTVIVDLLHIVRLEPLEKVKTVGNGQG